MPLQTAMQVGTAELGDLVLQAIVTIVQGQARLAPEFTNHRLLCRT